MSCVEKIMTILEVL